MTDPLYTDKCARIQQQLNSIDALVTPTPLSFDTFYTDTLNRPEGYDEFAGAYKHQPYQYGKCFDTEARYKKKGGSNCVVCMEDKPVRTMYFCRVCSNGLCSGCFNGCKAGSGHSHTAITPIDCDSIYDSKSQQPTCPSCRGEGTFATKGVNATRIVTFVSTSADRRTYTYGPNIFVDKTLKSHVKKYIKNYNIMRLMLNEKIQEDKDILTANIQTIMEDERYNEFASQININQEQVKALQQQIREIESDTYEIRHKREEYAKELLTEPAEIDEEWIVKNLGNKVKYNGNVTLQTLVKSLTTNYPRTFKRTQGHYESNDLAYLRGLNGIGQFADKKRSGGFNDQLDKDMRRMTDRVNALGAGCIMPIREADLDEQSDRELEEQMRMLQAIMDKRKAKGGGAKA